MPAAKGSRYRASVFNRAASRSANRRTLSCGVMAGSMTACIGSLAALRAQFAHIFTLVGGKVTRWRQYVDTKQFADVTRP